MTTTTKQNPDPVRKNDRNVAAQWAKFGIGFNVEPSPKTPDLERLLVDTAVACPRNARLFILAVTWLSKFGIYVAAHRLKTLATSTLAPEDQATLAVILETAVNHGAPKVLRQVVADALEAAPNPGPLLDVDRNNYADILEKEATETSKRWGRWVQPIELKHDAIRAPTWVIEQNPSLAWRAAHKGDLRCSIAETLRRDLFGGPVSESELARQCGATRAAVRAALADLRHELPTLNIDRQHGAKGSQIVLRDTTPLVTLN